VEADPERDRNRPFIEKPEWLPELDVRTAKDGITTMANTRRKTAGIDTSKLKLDVALVHDAAILEVENASQGFKELTTWLKRKRGYSITSVGNQWLSGSPGSRSISRTGLRLPSSGGAERRSMSISWIRPTIVSPSIRSR